MFFFSVNIFQDFSKNSICRNAIFSDFFKKYNLIVIENSRPTSSQRATRWRAVSLYVCYFSAAKAFKIRHACVPAIKGLKNPSGRTF